MKGFSYWHVHWLLYLVIAKLWYCHKCCTHRVYTDLDKIPYNIRIYNGAKCLNIMKWIAKFQTEHNLLAYAYFPLPYMFYMLALILYNYELRLNTKSIIDVPPRSRSWRLHYQWVLFKIVTQSPFSSSLSCILNRKYIQFHHLKLNYIFWNKQIVLYWTHPVISLQRIHLFYVIRVDGFLWSPPRIICLTLYNWGVGE